ncbi:hypothetical protein HQQ81_18305 [Microbacteriaceae bacterium VKM Ac-2854]|nr:hypothetical protein [Microbacteriaceae bacterium VKM Ac-2854]
MEENSAMTRELVRQGRYLLLMKLKRPEEAAMYAHADPAVIAEIAATRGPDVAIRIQAQAVRQEKWVKRGLRIRRFLPFLH